MPTINIIDPAKDIRWDKFVNDHPYGWIVHLSGWKCVVENSFKHIRGYYFAKVDDNNEIVSGLPVYLVKSWLTGNRLVSIPYATLCDPLVPSREEFHELFGFVSDFFLKMEPSYTEIRSHCLGDLVGQGDRLGVVHAYNTHSIRTDQDIDAIFRSFSRDVKRSINNAKKVAFRFNIGSCEDDLKSFYNLYRVNRKSLGLPAIPYLFFQSLWTCFGPSKKMLILLCEYHGKKIAGVIAFSYKSRFSGDYSAWDRTYQDIRPNHFLYWEAIKMAHQQGKGVFDFGRTALSNEGLMRFKNQWSRQQDPLHKFFHPKKAAISLTTEEKTKKYFLVNRICKNIPEPAYKMLGNFCYRHLG